MFDAARIGAGPEAIQAHYDAGDAFFALFLDETRTYSCALYAGDGPEELASAQRAKIDWHLTQSGLTRGGRLIDIGCGWGALLARAADAYGAHLAHGLTLSAAQAAFVRKQIANTRPLVRVALEDWADHTPDAPYDAAISIGAFEHFARPGETSEARIAAYRRFFAALHAMIAPGGRLSLQTIAYPDGFDRAAYDGSSFGGFVRARIFPDSDLPSLSELLTAAEPWFDLAHLRNDRLHYARTTRAWLERLRARRNEAEVLVGASRVADFERYFRLSIGCFELGNLLLLRPVFARRNRPSLVRSK